VWEVPSNNVMVPSGLKICSKIIQSNPCTRSQAVKLLQQQMLGTCARAGTGDPIVVTPYLVGGFGQRSPVCFLTPVSWAIRAVSQQLHAQIRLEHEVGVGECPFKICWYKHGSAHNSGQFSRSSQLSPQPWDFH